MTKRTPSTVPPISTTPAPDASTTGWHGAVRYFKPALLEHTLTQTNGNRTHAARALGLQRTHLLLIRDLDVQAPPAHHDIPNRVTKSTRAAARYPW